MFSGVFCCKLESDMDKVKQIIEDMLKRMTLSFDSVDVSTDTDGKSVVCIRTKESNLLIGNKGEHFLAFSHIIKKISSQLYPETVDFSVDINDYQKNNIEKLKQKALMLAERARSFNTSIEMDPMSSYERMIIHSLFGDAPDITTESVGLGKDRRIKIKHDPQKSI